MKPLSSFNIATEPKSIYIGKGTTLQDLVDYIHTMQAQLYAQAYMLQAYAGALRPVPKNVVDLFPSKIDETECENSK